MSKILLVEDDRSIRSVLARFLEMEEYRVECAANGEDALGILSDRGDLPALVILDLMMPVMDGWEFRKVQLSDPELSRIPVVILSACPLTEADHQQLRPVSVLQKPFVMEELLDIVNQEFSETSDSHQEPQQKFYVGGPR